MVNQYIYVKNTIVKEISSKMRGDLVDHDLIVIEEGSFNFQKNRIWIVQNINNTTSFINGIYVYYNKNYDAICLSPKLLDEYVNDNGVFWAIAPINDEISKILNGEKSLSFFEVSIDKEIATLKYKENLNSLWKLSQIETISSFEINQKNERPIRLKYNRSLKELEIDFNEFGTIINLELYFIDKSDHTKLFNSINALFDSFQVVVSDFNIPNEYIIINPTNNKTNICIEEI